MRTCVHSCLSSGPLSCRLCAYCQALWDHVCDGLDRFRKPCFLGVLYSSVSYSLSVSPSTGLPVASGKFSGGTPLRTEHLKMSPFLHIAQIWVSALSHTHCRKKNLWWQMSKMLSYDYGRMLSAFHCYVPSTEQQHWFPLSPQSIDSQVLGYISKIEIGFIRVSRP